MFNLFNEITKLYKKNYVIHKFPRPIYGLVKPNGEWTGMVGELMKNKADIIIAPVATSFERNDVITHSKMVYISRLGIVGSAALPSTTNVAGLVMVFDWEIWLALFLSATLMVFVASVSLTVSLDGKVTLDYPRTPKILNIAYQYFSAFLFEASEKEPGSGKNRLLFGIWWLTVLVLMNAFCGNFRANMMIQYTPDNIEEVSELAKRVDSLHPLVWKGTVYEDYFKNAKTRDNQLIWKAILKYNGSKNYKDFFSLKTILSLTERKSVLISELTILKYIVGQVCRDIGSTRLYIGKQSIFPHLATFGFRKNYEDKEFIKFFNKMIQRAVEGHLIHKWLDDEFGDYKKCMSSIEMATQRPLGLDEMGGIFLVVLVLQITAMLLFIFELLAFKK